MMVWLAIGLILLVSVSVPSVPLLLVGPLAIELGVGGWVFNRWGPSGPLSDGFVRQVAYAAANRSFIVDRSWSDMSRDVT